MSDVSILLTIAIPTWNRAEYLRINLAQLAAEMFGKTQAVEILISDNFSPDDTSEVVADFIARGMKIRYIRNTENIGSDHNIAQCFNEAAGQYVLILGDDDLLIDGALDKLLVVLTQEPYGVVSLRAYGYDADFRAELPASRSRNAEYSNPGTFIEKNGALSAFISGNVINKKIISGEDARKYCGTNLVQTYLIFAAAISAKRNIFLNQYMVACKRNNSGNYSFSQVFVDRFWSVVDDFSLRGLDQASINKLARNMLVGYYPYYLLKLSLLTSGNRQEDYLRFHARFRKNIWFWIMIAPLLKLPRFLALIWGGLAVLIGRSLMGDFYRGIVFVRSSILRGIQCDK